MNRSIALTARLLVSAAAFLSACASPSPAAVRSVPVETLPGHDTVAQDPTPKEGPRLMHAETYIRSYLQLFGGLAPLEVQARGQQAGLFDAWSDYLVSLGLPQYRVDLARHEQTNSLMVATFERLGVALCDMAALRDLHGALPVAQRLVYAFESTAAEPTDAEFEPRFDALHRTFLSYPAAGAPAERTTRFRELYRATVARHAAPGAARSSLTPSEAGWASVCYGLVRHPEFHLY